MKIPVYNSKMREIEEIEDDLSDLQAAYLEAEDEVEQMRLESKFTQLLMEATSVDGRDRVAANVTITNWTRQEES